MAFLSLVAGNASAQTPETLVRDVMEDARESCVTVTYALSAVIDDVRIQDEGSVVAQGESWVLKGRNVEIYTNEESRDLHKVKLGNYQISLRKPRTKIDKHNAPVLCYLELMNGIDTETLDEYKRKLISDYIAENRITQRQITKYIPFFPDKTCRNLIESEVIYRVPQ